MSAVIQSGEQYVSIPLDTAYPVGGSPLQVVRQGFPVTGVVVNGVIPGGVQLAFCRKGAPFGLILRDWEGIDNLFCPALDDGLYVYITGTSPGNVAQIIALAGPGGTLTRS